MLLSRYRTPRRLGLLALALKVAVVALSMALSLFVVYFTTRLVIAWYAQPLEPNWLWWLRVEWVMFLYSVSYFNRRFARQLSIWGVRVSQAIKIAAIAIALQVPVSGLLALTYAVVSQQVAQPWYPFVAQLAVLWGIHLVVSAYHRFLPDPKGDIPAADAFEIDSTF